MIATPLKTIAGVIHARCSAALPDRVVPSISTDSRELRSGEIFFAIKGERCDGHDFIPQAIARGAAACVLRRHSQPPATTAGPLLEVDDVLAALARFAQWHRRQCRTTVIAITGSNGKTTTKGMIAHVLSSRIPGRASIKSYNNHVGVPLTLLSCEQDDAFLVVEIGSNAPGEVATLAAMTEPDVAVVTSVGLAHLEGLGGLDGIRREKLSLIEHVRPDGFAIVNADALAGDGPPEMQPGVHLVTFGSAATADCRISDAVSDLDTTRATLNGQYTIELGVPGTHNTLNAAAAFLACRRLDLPPAAILAALRTFRMPSLRLNVHRCRGITIIDDCYNANPASMVAAIRVLASAGGRRILVAGWMAELGDRWEELHAAVGKFAADAGVHLLVTVGREAAAIARGAGTLSTFRVASAQDAARVLAGYVEPGDTVLIKGSRVAGLEKVADTLTEMLTTSRLHDWDGELMNVCPD